MKTVVFLTRALPHYRHKFHTLVREYLMKHDVHYRLFYSDNAPTEKLKGDQKSPMWAEKIPIHYLGSNEHSFLYQKITPPICEPDFLILGQHTKHLHNYPIIIRSKIFGQPLVAFFGHGKNFQTENPNGYAERFKRFWTNKVDWWFAYTLRCADAVVASGFPREQITVFNNAIDVSEITNDLASIRPEERINIINTMFNGSQNIGVYVGGMYPLKRLDFLIESAEQIRHKVPDFHLLIIGGGEDAHIAQTASETHEWIHYVGPKFGREKSLLASLGKVFLMPGLVGLAILDSFAYGTPMVTTNVSYHSPEFDYLTDDGNGLVVKETDNPIAYANAVTQVLTDHQYHERLVASGKLALEKYTIENMAAHFAEGVLNALSSHANKHLHN